jgi:hypothetical protein
MARTRGDGDQRGERQNAVLAISASMRAIRARRDNHGP